MAPSPTSDARMARSPGATKNCSSGLTAGAPPPLVEWARFLFTPRLRRRPSRQRSTTQSASPVRICQAREAGGQVGDAGGVGGVGGQVATERVGVQVVQFVIAEVG